MQLPTAASAIREFEVEKVVSSPFKRCLQTASCICRELQPPLDTIEIDYAMCEVGTAVSDVVLKVTLPCTKPDPQPCFDQQ